MSVCITGRVWAQTRHYEEKPPDEQVWDFFFPVKDFRWPRSSDSGIKLINNDLQTKHFELSVCCEQSKNGRKRWPCSPRYNRHLWLVQEAEGEFPLALDQPQKHPSHGTSGLDLCEERAVFCQWVETRNIPPAHTGQHGTEDPESMCSVPVYTRLLLECQTTQMIWELTLTNEDFKDRCVQS